MVVYSMKKDPYDKNGKVNQIGNFIIKRRTDFGGTEIVLSVFKNGSYGFMVALLDYCQSPDIVYVENPVVVQNYHDAMEVYSQTLEQWVKNLEQMPKTLTFQLTPFTDKDCYPMERHECIEGKIVAIHLEPSRFAFTHSAYQLVMVEGGAGATGERGRIFYGICLVTGERGIWRRSEVLGILRHDRIPDWAYHALAQMRKKK